jgi:molybdate transport system substrate-binding protein
MPVNRRLLLTLLCASCLYSGTPFAEKPKAQDGPLVVFAAASLTDALRQIAAQLEPGGTRMKLSFASSSTLARQIESGAAADIFVSADEEWMAYLDARKLIAKDTWTHPIGNDLVMVAGADEAGSIRLEPKFDLARYLGERRLAVGDPAHVPAGRYAQQALEHYGWWETVEPKLARAENVRAALALVERGEAPLAIVYTTDALASKAVRVVAAFPPNSHEPILYSFAATAGHDNPRVRAALRAITTGESLAIYRKSGFKVK